MKRYVENRNGLSIFASLITVTLFLLSIVCNDIYLMWFTILIVFLIIVLHVRMNGGKDIILSGFLISFFTFIMGKYILQMFAGNIQHEFSDLIFLKETAYVYLSLISLLVGYIIFKPKREITEDAGQIFIRYRQLNMLISRYAAMLFIVSIIFSIAVNIDKASMGFGNLYSITRTIESRLPFWIQKIGQMSSMFFWVYLSTLPSKRQIKIPIILFLFNATLTLFTGTRNIFVIDFLTVFMYIYFRHNIRDKLKEEIWISRKIMIVIASLIPFIVVFLGFMANIRLGEDIQYEGLFAGIKFFLEQQGGSADVIGYGVYCKESFLLPATNTSYTFGPIINYFKNGFLGGVLGYNALSTSSQDVALATYGNNLGATVTYLMANRYYFIGGGFGTCYIAELAVDFGYVGVIAYNLFLGWLFNNINYFMSGKWWRNAMGLLVIRNIIFMPRDFALGFVASCFSVTNLLPLLLVLLLEKYIEWRPRRGNHNKL